MRLHEFIFEMCESSIFSSPFAFIVEGDGMSVTSKLRTKNTKLILQLELVKRPGNNPGAIRAGSRLCE